MSGGRQFPAEAGVALPQETLPCSFPQPPSFLSNSMAKRLGHSGSRCAPGPSPAQVSELSGLGNLRGFVFCIFIIGFY